VCETPPGISKVEHLPGFFTSKIEIRMGNNTSKKRALWVKCKKPPVLAGVGGGFPRKYNRG
jgi:hypothetical protein